MLLSTARIHTASKLAGGRVSARPACTEARKFSLRSGLLQECSLFSLRFGQCYVDRSSAERDGDTGNTVSGAKIQCRGRFRMMCSREDAFHQVPLDEFRFIPDSSQGDPGIPLQQQITVSGQAVCNWRRNLRQSPA